MKSAAPPRAQWMPETQVRDSLLGEAFRLTHHHAQRERPLFWIDIREYMQHDHSSLGPQEWEEHWEYIYTCCYLRDYDSLRDFPYVKFSSDQSERLLH